jgi:predicted transcriptional regulator
MRIGDAELEVMEVLWATDAPLTATDVAERIGAERDWSLATIKTMLSRLSAKAAIRFREEGRRYLYSAAITRESYVGRQSHRLVDGSISRITAYQLKAVHGRAIAAAAIAVPCWGAVSSEPQVVRGAKIQLGPSSGNIPPARPRGHCRIVH